MRSRHRLAQERLRQEVVVRKFYQDLATERLHEVERLKYLLKQIDTSLGAGPQPDGSPLSTIRHMIRGPMG